MSASPRKFDSTTYKTARTPNLDTLKRQIDSFRMDSKFQGRRSNRLDATGRNVEDLEKRVDIVLKQNSHLLA